LPQPDREDDLSEVFPEPDLELTSEGRRLTYVLEQELHRSGASASFIVRMISKRLLHSKHMNSYMGIGQREF
jgi:hypothetical protein